ncbi:quinone-dependent dihydroorotate dehydrogenase [Nitrosospira multiformis]|uniref:Dihydroorotate dehydrogenase (quinone) n=2 Tax=Nitrosospira multiformis (strain ATCC 25196 / NCIMB 11849 / C 71) TaxID=323848 RepID=PYRD_NITMU|nr:quinone-dependent dihydroorotate dehydrogenase [Nitrosospira multiformis]Q2Y5H8.2 RecName: Full=Dihydroorotate dehydrogenase (quinone); AltName: Full=DHOdehase; Short=DHOD; Short=DHODase; AltName: Full=Dihydroorotate oxidase [Nitrosospira multiformis ATCC 25196]
MLYSLLRPLVFALEPETAHGIAFNAMETAHRLGLYRARPAPCRSRSIMGLTFPNPVGLAAGLDKNGEHIDALAALGFGFIEIGTVTPRPQPGNPKPRLFRLPQANSIINRMGFNNNGIEGLVANVKAMDYKGILGINIGKNFDTPVEKAVDDYLICLRKAYRYASYITVNISSPNTPNLRQLQQATELDSLLGTLKLNQQRLADEHGKYTPLLVKIAPDLELPEIDSIAALLMKHRVDGVIATNTTLSRAGVETLPHAREAGGLSGAPLAKRATSVVARLHHALQGALPIIGVGGIMDAAGATEKIAAGASLIQVYSGLVYRGPHLVGEIAQVLCNANGGGLDGASST